MSAPNTKRNWPAINAKAVANECSPAHIQYLIEDAQAVIAKLSEALVQHNDCLRSAQQIAFRDGADTNWKAFRGQATYTLAEYHELVIECRAKLADDCCDAGKVWNNADPTSGMWVPCPTHGGDL